MGAVGKSMPAGTVKAAVASGSLAKLLGIDTVPTIRLADMTEAQKRAYMLADNKLAENAGWDKELLALEWNQELEDRPQRRTTGIGPGPRRRTRHEDLEAAGG